MLAYEFENHELCTLLLRFNTDCVKFFSVYLACERIKENETVILWEKTAGYKHV